MAGNSGNRFPKACSVNLRGAAVLIESENKRSEKHGVVDNCMPASCDVPVGGTTELPNRERPFRAAQLSPKL
jgi:hypothetical protein